MGLNTEGATLAARILGPLPYWLTNWVPFPGTAVYWGIPPANTPDVPYAYYLHNYQPGEHFPYGLEVEPDEPV